MSLREGLQLFPRGHPVFGILENKMETTIIGYILGLYWGYIGIMENKMETTIM